MRIMHDFTDFPSGKFYDIWSQQRRLVSPCKLSKQNFENFTIRGRLKNAKMTTIFPGPSQLQQQPFYGHYKVNVVFSRQPS